MKRNWFFLISLLLIITSCGSSTAKTPVVASENGPVNKNATPATVDLLSYIYSISGKKTMSGEHEYMYKMSQATDSVFLLTGKYPAVWGGEFGFSDEHHDTDNIKYRPNLLKEIIRNHNAGAIITMTYHQAIPTIGEPCDFATGVQGKFSAENYKDLLTPGTPIYNTWLGMVDKLADMFDTLQNRNIPVLFRPYHEMNGGWFWWSGQKGDSNYIKLYKQLYDHFTTTRKLNNLIWVWSPSDPSKGLIEYYPGNEYVDIIGCDIYPQKEGATPEEVYPQRIYDSLLAFANGKPIVIGECSTFPTPEILEKQPNWAWMMGWVELAFQANSTESLKTLFNSDKVITRDELKK